MIIGFESAEVLQGELMTQAIAIAQDAGGTGDEDQTLVSDAAGEEAGRQRAAAGAWSKTILRAPYQRNLAAGLCLVADTLCSPSPANRSDSSLAPGCR